MEKDSTNSTDLSCESYSLPTRGVIVDIGTGDGRFVYQSAQENPSRFYIGIDASTSALEKGFLQKAQRKPAKGGLTNLLFVKAAVEELPEELTAIADEVHIHFPWGSLLKVVTTGEAHALSGIRKICRVDALLEVVIGIDPVKDKSEIARLNLPAITEAYLRDELPVRFASAGFHLTECGRLARNDWSKLCTTWARKLKVSSARQVFYLIAQAT